MTQIQQGTKSPDIHFPSVDATGLTSQQVTQLTHEGKVNVVDTTVSRSYWDIIKNNTCTLFNGIIFVAVICVLIAGQWRDAIFGVVIIVNAGIGIFTETRAKQTLDSLSILVAAHSMVRRNGKNIKIPHSDIVVGDLLWISAGDQVPADGVVDNTWGLELDESMLTGESRTIKKTPGQEVYSGSTVISGLALITVTAVGADSYASQLTAKAKVYRKVHSDLQDGINKILKYMTYIVVPLCLLLIWSQMRTVGGFESALQSGQWRVAVVSSVAGVIGMIPEGLVLLTSLNFALAAIRLAHKNTLVQQLESVETLARVDSLNLDKTGTITDGGITCNEIIDLGGYGMRLKQALFDALNEPQPNTTGIAVLTKLRQEGVKDHDAASRIPFSSARKWSAVATDDGSSWYCGAPEILLSALSAPYPEVRQRVNDLASQGNRVLLVASSHVTSVQDFNDAQLPDDLIPAGLVVCSESIRSDAQKTLKYFRKQGVRCRIISGDNPQTVAQIAKKVQLCGSKEEIRAVDARTLPDDISELSKVIDDIDVLGRVLPEQKKAIVQALHANNHVVAMTGDGVNDALAIKESDLGIAMGNAANATKVVAQVILVDSKFSHLPDVVAQGRQVMANMERVASLFLVKTVYSALIAFGVVLTSVPFPYLPRHMTYISTLTIGLPAFILSMAPNNTRYRKGFLGRVIAFSLPSGIAVGLSVMAFTLFLPNWMGWNIRIHPAQLALLRTYCATVVFALGIVVLCRVSRPLWSWRGGLVLGMALAGIAGSEIPFIADFFAIRLPRPMGWSWFISGLVIIILLFLVFQYFVQWAINVFNNHSKSEKS